MVIAVLLTASAIGNCNSAKLVASVKNPSYSGQRFKKVLVIGMSDNPAIRSDFEDALANKLARDGIEAIPGHSILLRPESANMDLDYLKAQIREHHIEAVLLTRLVKVEKNVTYIPGQATPFLILTTTRSTATIRSLTGRSILRTICAKTRRCASKPTSTPPPRPRENSSGPASATPSIRVQRRRQSTTSSKWW